MKKSASSWLKASLAAFSVSVVGAAIAAFSYASNLPLVHPNRLAEPVHSVSHAPVADSIAAREITQQMILERTASCAEMISPKDKVRCLNKRVKMKRDFMTQEKGKCEKLGGDAVKVQCFSELGLLMKKFQSA